MASSEAYPRTEQLSYANGYLHGEIDAPTAGRKMYSIDSFGMMLTGEVFTDTAMHYQPAAEEYMGSAHVFYDGVMANTNGNSLDFSGSRARAGLRLAQFDVAKQVYADGKLPDQEAVQDMYERTLLHAGQTARLVGANRFSQHPEMTEALGMLGRMTVMLLAQRHLVKDGIDDLVPLQGSFSEEHARNCQRPPQTFTSHLNMVGIEDGAPVSLMSLMIRSSRSASRRPIYGPTVHVEDLAMNRKEWWVGAAVHTVNNCLTELGAGGWNNRASPDLDARTNKLFDAIYAAAEMPVVTSV